MFGLLESDIYIYTAVTLYPAGEGCWEGVLEADKEQDIMCVQAGMVPVQGQEDCLYLSVRSPDTAGILLP